MGGSSVSIGDGSSANPKPAAVLGGQRGPIGEHDARGEETWLSRVEWIGHYSFCKAPPAPPIRSVGRPCAACKLSHVATKPTQTCHRPQQAPRGAGQT